MQHFFILGNNPTLSIAEITRIFPENTSGEIVSSDVFLLEEEFTSHDLIKRLGGTIKLGEILYTNENNNNLKKELIEIIKQQIKEKEITSKFKFGISLYGKSNLNTKKLGIEIKKELKSKEIKCRFVESREKTLSSVVVTQNKLIEKGIEIILIIKNGKILVGYSQAVQLFKELSKRDFGRPARDDKSGMIPPKLAQIMINLTGKNDNFLDPFCGSGTFLMEAALMEFKNITGSDLSKKAIDDTNKNTNWIKNNFDISEFNFKTYILSATNISEKIKPKSIEAIATEPYLGPQRGWHDIKKTIKELEDLYSNSLIELRKILKDDGIIVMIWPQFQTNDNTNKSLWKFLNPNISGFKIVPPLPEYLKHNKHIKLSGKETMTYGRPGQKIFREIVILKKA